jgi:hypothetical protein
LKIHFRPLKINEKISIGKTISRKAIKFAGFVKAF